MQVLLTFANPRQSLFWLFSNFVQFCEGKKQSYWRGFVLCEFLNTSKPFHPLLKSRTKVFIFFQRLAVGFFAKLLVSSFLSKCLFFVTTTATSDKNCNIIREEVPSQYPARTVTNSEHPHYAFLFQKQNVNYTLQTPKNKSPLIPLSHHTMFFAPRALGFLCWHLKDASSIIIVDCTNIDKYTTTPRPSTSWFIYLCVHWSHDHLA